MKRNLVLILILYISQNMTVLGQETKNYLTLSGNLAHFINYEEQDDFYPYPGYFKFAVSPGTEMIYSREISSKLMAETGIFFELGMFSSYSIDFGQMRFYSFEISTPFCFKRVFRFRNGNQHYVTSGVYLGKIIKVVGQYPDSQNWQKTDNKYLPYFSNDTFYSDLYLDWGYVFTRDKKQEISISPFLKYRFNSTWLNHHESKFNYGIKLNLTFKL
jgi:hypothetical protein